MTPWPQQNADLPASGSAEIPWPKLESKLEFEDQDTRAGSGSKARAFYLEPAQLMPITIRQYLPFPFTPNLRAEGTRHHSNQQFLGYILSFPYIRPIFSLLYIHLTNVHSSAF
ncbi:hypothetical protein K440DRAFT_619959 [Wilcoxina mikolae CBS 423.85]|nr:hypothetical protein K440DRAFT_619959 [Wilcoxina mikolae CBS 423.85]